MQQDKVNELLSLALLLQHNCKTAQLQLKLSTIATEAHQLYVAPNTTMLHKMVVRKTSETHKPTNKKDAFSRNNDTAKANYSFYTRTQHLTGAHYSRLQHSIDSCRTIMMSNLQKTCTNLLINAIHRGNLISTRRLNTLTLTQTSNQR